jgi:hypothetical protein
VPHFAVIQTRFEPLPHDTLVHVLTRRGGLTHPDATQAVRRNQGIIWEHFDREHADAVAEELSRLEYGVQVVESDDIPDLQEPRTVRWFELDDEAIRIPKGIRGDTVPIAWPKVLVVSLGQIAEVTRRTVRDVPSITSSASPTAAIAHDNQPHYVKRSALVDVLDLIGVDETGAIQYLRMPSHELSYGRIMGEGTNLNRFERFLVIVDYCVTHAREAIISPATRKVLVHRRPSGQESDGDGMQVIQEEVMQSRNRWLLLRAIHRDLVVQQEDDDVQKDVG